MDNSKKQSILITGGCGFIGTNLIEYLLEKTDWQINILDNLMEGKWEDVENIQGYNQNRVFFIKGDIRNPDDIEKAITDCSMVVNLAAQTGVIPSTEDPLFDADINVIGLINMLQAAKKYQIKKFIHASSAAPLGEQEMPIHEKQVPAPLSPYGASKLSGEGYCSAYSASYDLNTVVLRFSNVYGPKSYNKGSVIAVFLRQILNGESLTVYGNGKQTRDFIYVKDLCQAIYAALIKDMDNKFEIFQIATGQETSINRLVEYMRQISNKNTIKIINLPERKGEIIRNYSDISKAKKALNFNPETDIMQGLENTFNWFVNKV